MNAVTKTYRLPPTFVFDHIARDELPHTAVVHVTSRSVTVELTDRQAENLLDDARHYTDRSMGYARDYPGIVASARATARRLVADGVNPGSWLLT